MEAMYVCGSRRLPVYFHRRSADGIIGDRVTDAVDSNDDEREDSSGDAFLRDVARAEDRAPPQPDPTRIGRFVVHGRLGAGGHGHRLSRRGRIAAPRRCHQGAPFEPPARRGAAKAPPPRGPRRCRGHASEPRRRARGRRGRGDASSSSWSSWRANRCAGASPRSGVPFPSPRLSTSPRRSRAGSPDRIARASSIATSSPRTSSSPTTGT